MAQDILNKNDSDLSTGYVDAICLIWVLSVDNVNLPQCILTVYGRSSNSFFQEGWNILIPSEIRFYTFTPS